MKTFVILFLIVTLAGCARQNSRQNVSRARSSSRSKSLQWPRGEEFENFFNVYDPSFLAIAWPKINNGVHIVVSRACWKDLSVFFKDLSDGKAWAYKVVDASGRYRAGLFEGKRLWLGSKKKCYQLDEEYMKNNETFSDFRNDEFLNTATLREKYLGDVSEWRSLVQKDDKMRSRALGDTSPPHRLAYTAVNLILNITKVSLAKSYDITLGVCLPKSCTLDDVHYVISFSVMLNDNFKSNKTIPRTINITSLRQVYDYYDIKNDTAAIVLITVTITLFVIGVLATLFDMKLIKCAPRNSKSMSFDLQKFTEFECRKPLPETYSDFRKQTNVVDMETLTISKVESSITNMVTVKKVTKANAMPPSITLDVVSMDRMAGSCNRCGKYKKQCTANIKNPTSLKPCPRVKSFASLTEHKEERFFKSLFLCFSLSYSWKRIFNTNTANKDLCLVHVLRILATFWVIYVHVAMIASYTSEKGADINEFNNAYYILLTGTLAFDTLFFVSGLLSAHHFLYLRRRYSVKELVNLGGRCGHVMQVVCFITNRAIRLLPSYVYAIFIAAVASRVTSHTSVISVARDEGAYCEAYWWRNLLYISNAFPEDEQCLQVSWAVSLETQLHAGAALLCAACGGAGLPAASALLLVVLATVAHLTTAYYQFGSFVSDVYEAYSVYVARPLSLVAPYFIGVAGGWLVHRLDGNIHISKTKSCFLWALSCTVLLGCVVTPVAGPGWLSAWLAPLWAAGLLGPAVISATHATIAAALRPVSHSSAISALSRLSNGAILLHVAISRLLLLPQETALCSTNTCIWVYFSGVSVVTVLCALLLSLLVETPACSLLRRLSDYAS